ncbi:MAG: AbrB/MazE/SpoVT family DNA-binding domain-containing protein [Thermodesulfovibrionales bacterium]|nr:AbrB/MazE/SpoVT family DNA-binding domain-containing protein [Thermodesulfovibrionales bacterium]
MLVQVKKRAQITIPLQIRKAMGIKEGDMLEVGLKESEIVLKPVMNRTVELMH